MASTIQIKRGTGSAVPSGLADGELAINLDDGRFYFGSGSTSVNSFRFTNLIADNYIVSSSVTNITTQTLSGSTAFGDSSDDTHQFTGSIELKGSLTSTNTITAEHITSTDDMTVTDDLLVNGNISGSFASVIHAGSYKVDDQQFANMSGGTFQLAAAAGVTQIDLGKSNAATPVFANGSITCSNDISSSGKIYANRFGEFIEIFESGNGAVIAVDSAAGVGNSIFGLAIDGTTKIQLNKDTIATEFSGNTIFDSPITASGDISSSGVVYADNIIVSSLSKGIAFSNLGLDTDQYIHGFGNVIKINGDNYVQIIADNEVKINAPKLGIGTIYSEDNSNQVPEALTVTGNISASGNTIIEGHITASGDISSSGTITAAALDINGISTNTIDVNSGDNNVAINATSTDADCVIRVQDNSTAGTNVIGFVATGDDSIIRNDEGNFKVKMANNATTTLDLNQNGDLFLTGHITASNNISASGIITAASMSIGGDYIAGRSPVQFKSHVRIFDNFELKIGDGPSGLLSSDLRLYHDGTDSYIKNSTGEFIIEQSSGDTTIKNFGTDGVKLVLDNNPNNGAVGSTGTVLISGSANPGIRLDVRGDITASGDISSSGDITSATSKIGLRNLGGRSDDLHNGAPGSTAQGDVFYHVGVSTDAGKIYTFQTNGNIQLADKDTGATATGSLFIAVGDSSADGMLLRGMVKMHTDVTANPGDPLYLGDSGLVTTTIPSSGDFARIIGHYQSGSGLIYFNPDNTFVEIS